METKLNEKQLDAIRTLIGPLLIIAGPGAGKTKTLVERTFNLIYNQNIKPEHIILSTFTIKASKELFSKISDKLSANNIKFNLNNMYIGTLHSIFKRLIDENIEYSRFKTDFRVLDDIDTILFLYTKFKSFEKIKNFNEFFKYHNVQNNWEKVKKLIHYFNIIDENDRDLSTLKTTDKSIIFIKEAYDLYKSLLIDENVIDFATIEEEFHRMLLTHKSLREKLSAQFKYIMVDEYQDTNIIQEKILFILSEVKKNICVVGDDDQSIYRFRGATVKNILTFKNKFSNCKIIIFDINYRSQLDIIRLCNHWISLLKWGNARHQKTIIPAPEKPFFPTSPIIRIGGDSEQIWMNNLYKFVTTLYNTKKITNYNQIAFLFRSVTHPRVKKLKEYFENSGIKVFSPKSTNIFDKLEFKVLIGVYLAIFPHTKYLVIDNVFLKSDQLNNYYKNCLQALKLTLHKDKNFKNWVLNKRNSYLDSNIKKYDNFKTIFYELLQFDFFKDIISINTNEKEQEIYNLAIYTDILNKFEHLTKIDNLNEKNIEKYLKYFFNTFIKYLYLSRLNESNLDMNIPNNSVSFLTIHQSKGLEFPVVIVDSLDTEPAPTYNNYEEVFKAILNIDTDEDEEKKLYYDFWRLYYTAFSRAKELLVLTSIEMHNLNHRLPSKFFNPLFYSVPSWSDTTKFSLKHLDISNLENYQDKELISFTNGILLYELCPLKYKLSKLYKFSPKNNKKTFYGIFFHKIIELINKFIAQKNCLPLEEKIVEIVNDVIKNLATNSVIHIDNEMKLTALKDVKNYINSLHIEGTFEPEKKLYDVENKYIIEGIIDLLKIKDETIEIIDFKTGKYTEENFKFYRRQLAIYSFLVKSIYPEKNIISKIYFSGEDSPYFDTNLNEEEITKEILHFKNIAEKILSKDYNKKNTGQHCEKCDFRFLCLNNKEE